MADGGNNDGNSRPSLHLVPRLVVLNLQQQHIAHLPIIPTNGIIPGKFQQLKLRFVYLMEFSWFSLFSAQCGAGEGGPWLLILHIVKVRSIELLELMNYPGKLKDSAERRNVSNKFLLQQQGK